MRAPYLGKTMGPATRRGPNDPTPAIPVEGDDLDYPLYTGRQLVTLNGDRNDYKDAIAALNSSMNMKIAVSSDFQQETYSEDKIADADVFLYEDIGIALVSALPHEVQEMETMLGRRQVTIEPELVMYAIPLEGTKKAPLKAAPAVAPASTWGIHETRSDRSAYDGRNVRVALLDTGLYLDHPDFTGRVMGQQSFVPGQPDVDDLHGHGTHCTGIACGNQDPAGTRYGVASGSNIFVGKILDHGGRGAQSWAINGINWAVNNHCRVISMSVGATVLAGISYLAAYERTIANAVAKGALVVAAAGNDSKRPAGMIYPVSSPGNSPSAIAVTAVDRDMEIAFFANGSINPGQDVFIAGPGVDIYSSWPLPKRYRSISGTSMATPFVSGIVALLWEKHPDFSPLQIKAELRNLARHLPGIPPPDMGSGFVLAP